MSTNKQAYKRAIVSSGNYKTVFNRYELSAVEVDKLYRFLKPLYTYFEDDYIIFKFPKPTQLQKLIQEQTKWNNFIREYAEI